jgi:hypothetical protein
MCEDNSSLSFIVVELAGEVANFNITLRFLELYWVGPIVQKRPVYTTLESLFIDFWSCMRTFPKPAKQDGDGLKKGQVKEYPKDKVKSKNGVIFVELTLLSCFILKTEILSHYF